MSKRIRHLVVLSDDEGDDDHGVATCSSFPPQDETLVPTDAPKRNKQLSVSKKKKNLSVTESRRGVTHQSNKTIDFWNISECEEVQYQVSSMQLWVDKYSPKQIMELAVHTRKVAEVRDWLEAKLNNSDNMHTGSNVLVLSGPTGVGKTATTRVLVDLLNLELCEWDPPVPTLWKEHAHNMSSGAAYVSKLQEFMAFLESVKNYPMLPSMYVHPDRVTHSFKGAGICRKGKALLLDDLPIVHGREAASQLCYSMHKFALSVQFPTIVILTDFSETADGQGTNYLTPELEQALESAGASKVTFNPITVNAIKKVLTKILGAEKCLLPSESLASIAESCGGDVRHAIYCLQFLCLGQTLTEGTWDPGGVRSLPQKSKRRKVSIPSELNRKALKSLDTRLELDCLRELGMVTTCRDGVLSLFHALGKVLYNKRLLEEAKDSGECINLTLKDHLQRHPLNMEIPETILSQVHTDTSKFTSFLFENLLDFVDDDGIEDAAACIAYLSDVDSLLGVKYRVPKASSGYSIPNSDELDPGHVAEAAAGSLALRGVLFANAHPGKHRWRALRAPAVRQVERLMSEKKVELCAKTWGATVERFVMVTRIVQTTEYQPYQKQILSSNQTNSNPAMAYPWRCLTGQEVGIYEEDYEIALSFSQEQELSSSVNDINIKGALDFSFVEPAECEDEIEEW